MGKRLSKIYTRTGDDGTTGMGDGSRVPKDSTRVTAIGNVDEVNTVIGVLLCEALPEDIEDSLLDIQHRLFDLGGELSIPGYRLIKDAHITAIENCLDRLNEDLDPLENFILPGGTRAAALCHQARAVCRRAERDCVCLQAETSINPAGLRFLNRLSDLLFVMARYLNSQAGVADVLWEQDRKS